MHPNYFSASYPCIQTTAQPRSQASKLLLSLVPMHPPNPNAPLGLRGHGAQVVAGDEHGVAHAPDGHHGPLLGVSHCHVARGNGWGEDGMIEGDTRVGGVCDGKGLVRGERSVCYAKLLLSLECFKGHYRDHIMKVCNGTNDRVASQPK